MYTFFTFVRKIAPFLRRMSYLCGRFSAKESGEEILSDGTRRAGRRLHRIGDWKSDAGRTPEQESAASPLRPIPQADRIATSNSYTKDYVL